MKTEEAIEKSEVEWAIKYLKTVKHDQWVEFHYINEAVPIIITLLQQGEKAKYALHENAILRKNIEVLKKYRQMWESMVNASKCLIDNKGRKVLKMVIRDIKQGMKEYQKYLKEATHDDKGKSINKKDK